MAKAHAAMMRRLCGLSRKAVLQVQHSGKGTKVDAMSLADTLTWLIGPCCARFIFQIKARDVPDLVDLFAHIAGRAIFAEPSHQPAKTQEI